MSAKKGLISFTLAMLLVYGTIPMVHWYFTAENQYFLLLSYLSIISAIFIIIGYFIPLFDGMQKNKLRIKVSYKVFVWWIPIFFIIFIIYTMVTAPTVPILTAVFSGASPSELSEQRGAFLKGRSGIEAVLLYLSTILVNTIMPYALVVLFALKNKARFYLLSIFFIYSISFLQKALFLNVLLPLVVFFSSNYNIKIKSFLNYIIFSFILLLIFTAITYDAEGLGDLGFTNFMSSSYLPNGALDYLVWRLVAVPIFTASDTLLVHANWFKGDYLLGATSTFLSMLFDQERINIERYVFEYQFGGWNETANANAVFFLDGYMNFGIVGVMVYSIIVGQFFRIFAKTKDKALASLWIVFAISVFTGSLIGVMLGGGWGIIIFYTIFCKNGKLER